MRNLPFNDPASQTYKGSSNQPLYVQLANTLRTGFFKRQYDLHINHQQEDVVDGGFAGTTQFHFLIDSVLDDNGASLNTPEHIFDANDGVAGTANYVLPRRPRIARR